MRRQRTWRAVGVLAVAVLGSLGSCAASRAAGWANEPVHAPPVLGGTLSSVSCPASDACMAVGWFVDDLGARVALAETWDGNVWTRLVVPPLPGSQSSQFTAVSCTAAHSCMAVGVLDYAGGQVMLAEQWNGSAWNVEPAAATATPLGLVTGVSCSSPSACTAVGSTGDAHGTYPLIERWDGVRWSLQTVAEPANTNYLMLESVSCPSASSCTAVGDYSTTTTSGGPFAAEWSGSGWTVTLAPASATLGGLLSVSCVAVNVCMATGAPAQSESWDGTSWTSRTTANGPSGSAPILSGVSCAAGGGCDAVGRDNALQGSETVAEHWNGSSWVLQTSSNATGAFTDQFDAVSCAPTGGCEAVGFDSVVSAVNFDNHVPLIEAVNGTAWTIQPGAAVPAGDVSYLSGVACPAADFCMAVGVYGTATAAALTERWDGSSWTQIQAPAPSTGGRGLSAVACPATTDCVAVGDGFSEIWNGSAWSVLAQDRNGTALGKLLAISCASSNACVAVGQGSADSWNGADWTPIAAPTGYMSAISCPSATMCMAVGQPDVELWNGSRWTTETLVTPPSSTSANVVLGVSCVSETRCTVVGYDGATTGTPALVERWDGSTWSIEPTALLSGQTELASVSCIAADECVAVGAFGLDPFGVTLTGDTTTATAEPISTGLPESIPADVSCASATACMTVGYAGGLTRVPLAAFYSGPPPPSVAPRLQLPPSASGATRVGDTLSATTGAWAGTAPITYTYQWQRCGSPCSNIVTATGSSYRLTTTDLGSRIRVLVTATNAAGSASALSGLVGPVTSTATPPANMATASRLRLRSLAGQRPTLRFGLTAGAGAPAIARFIIRPGGGLGLSRQRRGITLTASDHRHLRFHANLNHGTLTIALSAPSRSINVKIGAPTLVVSNQIRNDVKHHRSRRVRITLEIQDTANTDTTLTFQPRVG